jgi:quercetin dioxygenase-like cupin family protein
MSGEEDDILAAEYVLGLLDAEDEARAQRLAARDVTFAAKVAVWAERLDALDPVQPVAPSDDLWARIDSAIGDTATAPGTRTLRRSAGVWEQIAPGIEQRVLFVDRAAGTQSYYIRMTAGAVLPAHRHRRVEECVVVSGRLRIGEFEVGPGDFHLAGVSNTHPAITAVEPSLFYIHGGL